ncbi:MAG: hypothetical protein HOE76_01665 [Euryarchaeota archaeon]|nr:hypothetical protein [Euryarchaeota archaeon]
MRNRSVLSLSILVLLLGSLVPVTNISVLEDSERTLFADSEPEMLVQAGTSTGHVNGSQIEATPNGWVISGDTRNSLTFGAFQLQATSVYNNQLDADSYVASIDSQGNWLWAIMPDATQGLTLVTSMTSSIGGDIFIGGLIFGDVNFGSTLLSAQNGYGDGFIAKVGPGGQWMWAVAFDTATNSVGNSSIVTGLAASLSGDVIVSGTQKGYTDFGGINANNTDSELFIASLDANSGILNWVTTAGGIGDEEGGPVSVDSMGTIWQAGTTSGTFSANGKSHQAVSQADTVVIKWSAQGVVQDVIGLSSAASEINIPHDLIVTQTDDIVVSGVFLGSLDAGNQNTLSDKGNGDGYVVKLLKSGASSWATSAGGSSSLERVYSIAETSNGDFIAGGMIGGSADFGIHVTNTNGGLDLYVAQLDSMGTWQWVENLGGTADDLFADLALNMTDKPAALGSFQSTINKGTQSVTSSGGLDLVIWSLDPINNADRDNDGVNDLTDNCPDDNNPLQYDSDLDGNGDECDYDDDNDGITDNSGDDCPRGGAWNWTSNSTTDFDNDGCKDSSEDDDDDNDGIDDDSDGCMSSYSPPRNWWVSDTSNDIDSDGCRDADEDLDDDGDGYDDAADDCNKIAGNSTLGAYQGCIDSDDDGWADIEDTCPNSAGNSTLGGAIGCPDTDGDGWSDDDDAFDNDPTQWDDADGDGYGDNQDGNTPDACINLEGTSVLDRYGCPDPDSDGYSSGDQDWTIENGADAFPLDETQWSDWDEDGFGDNFGNLTWLDRNSNWPGEYYQYARDQDACPTLFGTSWQEDILGCPDSDGDGWANFMDGFPNDPDEYQDSDMDGVADGADDCPDVPGNSTNDILGCPDFDGDGWGDPSLGSDWNPMDPTQWANSDGDQYGDNPVGNNPDFCPDEAGYSFEGDVLGCVDTDGDGWADIIDKFSTEPTQWNDSDEDGFGDNPNGRDADKCPEVAGVAKENGCEEVIVDSSGSSILTYGGIGIGVLVVVIVIGLLIMRRMDSDEDDKIWSQGNTIPEMPNMNAMPVNQGLYSQHVQPQHTGPALSSLPGNMEIAPQQVVSPEPTVVQQWTDANGHTWRSMSDGSTLWWNGADWQRT